MTSDAPFQRFLDNQGFIVLDGGLATELEAAGHRLESGLWSAQLLVDAPDAIRGVHAVYLEAGADCIATASYQASFAGFASAGIGADEAEAALRRSVRVAVEARDSFWRLPENRSGRLKPIVAASAGPYGAFLADGSEYDGRYGVRDEVLAGFHRSRLEVLADTEADLIAFETIPSMPEARVICDLLSDLGGTRAWISFSCGDDAHLWDGTSLAEAVRAVSGQAALVGVGVNCVSPHDALRLVETVLGVCDLPAIVYPNSGEGYDAPRKAWSGPPAGEGWLDLASQWITAGASVVGGCCRVGPRTIQALRARLSAQRRRPTLS